MLNYETEILLERWGRWATSNPDANIGFKSQANFARLAGSTVSSAQITDAEAMEVDSAVASLIRLNKEQGYAVKIFYTHNCNTSYVARVLSMSRSQADTLIKVGTGFIAGLLFGGGKC